MHSFFETRRETRVQGQAKRKALIVTFYTKNQQLISSSSDHHAKFHNIFERN